VANIAALGAASGTAATDIGTLYTKVNAILAALKTAAVMAADCLKLSRPGLHRAARAFP
jgi:hypothetical protein